MNTAVRLAASHRDDMRCDDFNSSTYVDGGPIVSCPSRPPRIHPPFNSVVAPLDAELRYCQAVGPQAGRRRTAPSVEIGGHGGASHVQGSRSSNRGTGDPS